MSSLKLKVLEDNSIALLFLPFMSYTPVPPLQILFPGYKWMWVLWSLVRDEVKETWKEILGENWIIRRAKLAVTKPGEIHGFYSCYIQ